MRFDLPIVTTDSATLCPRQHQIAALRRALGDNDRAAFDRAAREGVCKVVGPDIRLAVVARPGAYNPDREVWVLGDATPPRGKTWTLKSIAQNLLCSEARAEARHPHQGSWTRQRATARSA